MGRLQSLGQSGLFGPSSWMNVSLQRKMALWTSILIFVPMMGYAFWTVSHAQSALMARHHQNVSVMAQALAATLVGQVNVDALSSSKVLDALELDDRLAFVEIQKSSSKPVHRRVLDNQALAQYEQWRWDQGRLGSVETDQAVQLDEAQGLVLRKVPIWDPPIHQRLLTRHQVNTKDRQLMGFVVLAMSLPQLQNTLQKMRYTQLWVASGFCLFTVPLVMWAVRKWTKPLRSLLKAAQQLQAGQAPSPIAITHHDELGVLAMGFNQMSIHLYETQQQLLGANNTLESKVLKRTAELELSNDRLESEINDRNDFIRAVTHDLSAPLRNIHGMASMILKKHAGQLNPDSTQKLQRINANVDIQEELIGDLLELSRLRTQPTKNERVNFTEMLEQLRQSISYDLEDKGIELVIQDMLPTLCCQTTRLRQVFQNLLDNAIKYMNDTGEKKITVSHWRDDKKLYFKVADTGSGIASKDLPHIFEVFRRATGTGPANGHNIPGRGVGLTSVKTIIELYGGQIWAQSEPGKGSSFTFTLDRRLVEPKQNSLTAISPV